MKYPLLRAGVYADDFDKTPEELLSFAQQHQLTAVAWSSRQIPTGDLMTANKIAGDSAPALAAPMLYDPDFYVGQGTAEEFETALFTASALNCMSILLKVPKGTLPTEAQLTPILEMTVKLGKIPCLLVSTLAEAAAAHATIGIPNVRICWMPDKALLVEENFSVLQTIDPRLFCCIIPSYVTEEEYLRYRKVLHDVNEPFCIFFGHTDEAKLDRFAACTAEETAPRD